jgi:hypothetical protein
MEKGIVDVELMDRPVLSDGNGQNCPNSCRLDNRTESLTVVDTGALGEAPEHPTCFVPV